MIDGAGLEVVTLLRAGDDGGCGAEGLKGVVSLGQGDVWREGQGSGWRSEDLVGTGGLPPCD